MPNKTIKILIYFVLVLLVSPSLALADKITYRLTINVIGGGSVNPSPGTYFYTAGTVVFINAIPNADWAFDHWEGDLSGTDLYTQITMNGHKTVTAVFTTPECRLTLTHIGDATGTTFPGPGVYGFLLNRTIGISCGTSEGVYFGGWSGDVQSTDEFITVTMDSDKQIYARFTSTGFILNVYIIGEGGATPGPFGNPHRYSTDIYVNVRTYQTNPLWRFDHWEGDIDDNDPQSSILFNLLMDKNRNITAVFIEKPYYTLNIEIVGEGRVSLQVGFDDPIPLDTGTHQFSYIEWTYIRCEATETSTDWKFLRWEGDFGDTSPTYPRCAFSMDQHRSIRCIFTNETTVPNVIGLTQSQAQTSLTNAWLTIGNITQVCSDEYPAGTVTDQNPSEGTITNIGSSVDLWVSTGPCPVSVPNIIGLTPSEAESVLASAQLTLGNITQQCHDEVEAGKILNQTPQPGEVVPPNSSVDVTIASGPCPVTVPNIVWKTQAEAEAILLQAGLTLGVIEYTCDDNIPATWVITQNPPAGQQVPPGTPVNLLISTGPCLVTVPNITGYSRSLAETILINASLVPGEITFQCDNRIRLGIVINQNPPAGSQVPTGSAVNFVVSLGPCLEGSPDGEGTPEGTPEEGEITPEGTTEGQPEEGEITTEGTGEGETEGTPMEGTLEGTSEGAVEGGPEGDSDGEYVFNHSADPNNDGKINLSELLRVIQFFNIGGYHCALPQDNSTDGYLPGFEGDKSCPPHSSDYNPQDWKINLTELLRLIQFFNIGGYYRCNGTEDGFCPRFV